MTQGQDGTDATTDDDGTRHASMALADAGGAVVEDGARHDHAEPAAGTTADAAEDADDGFEDLLTFLKDERGFDVTGYKRSTLRRRVAKRMDDVGVEGATGYLDHLQVHPEEVADLFDTILINVTAFRRDPEHWDFLRDEVLVPLLRQGEQVRIWSAGCSTGEEAYTLAMECCEAIGEDAFRSRVKIYATDVDGDALATARRGTYAASRLADLPNGWRERYFDRTDGDRWEFRRGLRRSVIFGRHDIVQDAPISRIDLLVCRNLLMYFTAEAQARILSRLHFALKPEGRMFLGRAEMLLTRTRLFTPVDLGHRVFTPSPDATRRRTAPAPGQHLTIPPLQGRSTRLRDVGLMHAPIALVAVDDEGVLALANLAARRLFGLHSNAVGRRFSDLELSYRPIELRGHMEEATRDGRTVTLSNVARVGPSGDVEHIDIRITPLREPDGAPMGLLLSFEDVSGFETLRAELQRSNHDLETAYEELQSSNEELLTTNEELQSTVEELETTNEELQSANEELETMNEELQSSTLEQSEVNTELAEQTRELNEANAFLGALLSTLEAGVIVLDDELRVRVWDDNATNTWGLRSDEVVGEVLTSLDCGLPAELLAEPVRETVRDGRDRSLGFDAVNRVGRDVRCEVEIVPLDSSSPRPGVVVLVRAVRR